MQDSRDSNGFPRLNEENNVQFHSDDDLVAYGMIGLVVLVAFVAVVVLAIWFNGGVQCSGQ